jgi:cell division septation protein DedD/nucleoid DNA-binding protein
LLIMNASLKYHAKGVITSRFFHNFAVMNLEQSIGELLFDHDCVIIPGFGGFVSNYRPAQIHPTQHTFSPPSKSIVFNRNLKNNDGLLANHLVQKDGLSYSEACTKISEYVTSFSSTLNSGKKLVLVSIGTLFHDIEKNIQFEPDPDCNYLLDSFGLVTIQSPSIKRDGFVKRLEKEPKDREVVPAKVKRSIPVRRYVMLTLAAGVLFTGIWIPLKTDLFKGINYANLNPFANKEKSTYVNTPFAAPALSLNKLKPLSPVPAEPAANTAVTPSRADEVTAPVKTKELAVPESTAVSATVSEKIKKNPVQATTGEKYSVIGGCFAVPENADHYLDKLRSEGFDPFILQTNSYLKHVSYGSYSSYNDAMAMLAKARGSNKDAWLLIK